MGFRLCQWSSASRFCISLDLAYLLSITVQNLDELKGRFRKKWFPLSRKLGHHFDIYFHGTEILRGVLGGLDYPLFSIDLGIEQCAPLRLDAKAMNEPASFESVRLFAERFYEERGAYVSPPFINSDVSLTRPHPNYEKFLNVFGTLKNPNAGPDVA